MCLAGFAVISSLEMTQPGSLLGVPCLPEGGTRSRGDALMPMQSPNGVHLLWTASCPVSRGLVALKGLLLR